MPGMQEIPDLIPESVLKNYLEILMASLTGIICKQYIPSSLLYLNDNLLGKGKEGDRWNPGGGIGLWGILSGTNVCGMQMQKSKNKMEIAIGNAVWFSNSLCGRINKENV